MRRVFVTGGGGFLGFAIVRQLITAGYQVITYSRKEYACLADLGVTQMIGDLADYDSLKSAMHGSEAVFHVAAKTGIIGTYQLFYRTNVVGTRNVINACREHHVSYLVYTSSPSVVFSGDCEGEDEHLPYPERFSAPYPATKAIAEQAILAANDGDLVTCALRPHLIWGPGDTHYFPRLLERRRAGRLRILGEGQFLVDTIYIDNAASAHLRALAAMQTSPLKVGGRAYFLSQDQPIPIREFIDRQLAAGDLPPVDRSIHPRLALLAGWVLERLYKLFGIAKEPPVTTFIAKQLSSAHWYDISAAKRELGYVPIISIDEGMNRLKAWASLNK